jgi:hypothetical protein
MDYASNLAIFLTERKGSCLATWQGKMPAVEQRALFGRFLGKGDIVVDGVEEVVLNRVSVCFGQDWDDRNITRWRNL